MIVSRLGSSPPVFITASSVDKFKKTLESRSLLGSTSLSFLFQTVKLEQHKGESVAFVYLFIDADGDDLGRSVNRQLAQSHLWKQLSTPGGSTVANINGCDAKCEVHFQILIFKYLKY